MNLDQIFLYNLILHKKLGNILALIPLELYDISKLLILHNSSVAAEF